MHVTSRDLVLALWIGGGVALMFVAAPAVFKTAPDSTIAGAAVGEMLGRWRVAAVVFPILLMPLTRGRLTGAILVFALILAGLQWGVDRRIHAIRSAATAPISTLAKDDPLRRSFGRLHGLSALTMLLHLASGVATLVLTRKP